MAAEGWAADISTAAASIAACHETTLGAPSPVPAWSRLAELPDWLARARPQFVDPPDAAVEAAEWLLDNEHQLRRAVRQVAEDLPAAFYRRLPRLADADFGGVPRVWAVAQDFLATVRMHVESATLEAFLAGYQERAALTIGELWALPAMLRLACIDRVVKGLCALIPGLETPLDVSLETVTVGAADRTQDVSHGITALIRLSSIAWDHLFERVSIVEAILRQDGSGTYARMDFETRDRYRSVVEEIAEHSPLPETAIARAALEASQAHRGDGVQGHVGWWLVDEGRPALEAQVSFDPPTGLRLRRWALRHAGIAYASGLAGFGLLSMLLPAGLLLELGASPAQLTLGLLLAIAPASIISVTVTHWLVTVTMPPRVLSKLDFSAGIAEGAETAVVIPVILRSEKEVQETLEKLELIWLSNPDPRICCCLLSDLGDAPEEVTPTDAGILSALVGGIGALNDSHAEHRPFCLLHRSRRWSASEGAWMGWERKRGKLEQFNAFMAGEADAAFSTVAGATAKLRSSILAVALDIDTTAPPGAIQRLAGTLAHPLNRARIVGGRVERGYTFLQPRVEIAPESGLRSLFTRLYTGDTAIDIYSRAVSDVYQDLFAKGIYIGKGAYDIAAMHRVLGGRVPENAMLSHDLFEGLLGRAALVSDVVFYEDFPPDYVAYVRRQHRWVRGDWQLLPFLMGRLPGRAAGGSGAPLALLDRWKIIDNLRRSLLPPSLVVLAVCGWLILPGSAWIWTGLTVAAPAAYLFTDTVSGFARGWRRGAVRRWRRMIADHAGRWMLAIVFMANDALVAIDAISRTCWRMFVTRRKMLQWTASAHVAAGGQGGAVATWSHMPGAPLAAVAIALAIALLRPESFVGALPLLAVWFLSPQVAFLSGRVRSLRRRPPSAEDRRYLRRVARRTWYYFETFAGPADNWLPPDNYQAPPHEAIAHRTSPTNIGMLCLSSLTALDLGHIGLAEFDVRTRNLIGTLDQLPKYHGHLLNWIDTRTLEPLTPRYVSAVDSGNLAVSLVTLGEGCREAAEGPVISPALWDGLEDCFALLQDSAATFGTDQLAAIEPEFAAVRQILETAKPDVRQWRMALEELTRNTWPRLEKAIAAEISQALASEAHAWIERTGHHIAMMARDLDRFAPWLAVLDRMPEAMKAPAGNIWMHLGPDTPLSDLGAAADAAIANLDALRSSGDEGREWADRLDAAIGQGVLEQEALRETLLEAVRRTHEIAYAMDFRLLFDHDTRTFFIGYDTETDRLDQHHYDLLASEARLTSYFAVAKRDVPIAHWFHLWRPMATVGGRLAVLSWNGSMFEYLMPTLLLRGSSERLVGESERSAVEAQIRYGARLGHPWGVSESAFATQDAAGNYQYQAFGVPEIGLKRGLSEDYVVSPYASALALAVDPVGAIHNLRRLEELGVAGRYGFYDAADFTAGRRPPERDFAVVSNFMAHHQGMLLAAIDNALNDDILVRRFGREPRMRAMRLLLEERVPREYVPEILREEEVPVPEPAHEAPPALDSWEAPDTAERQLHVIGSRKLSAWITDSGGGALWSGDQSLTRWTGDQGCDDGGMRIFFRDTDRPHAWSFGHKPTGAPSQEARVVFHGHMAEFHQSHDEISLHQEICVSTADAMEVRRITLVNESDRPREIELTSYAEVVLESAAAHARHPAFSKLFVHSERIEDRQGVLFARRPKHVGDSGMVLLHRLVCDAGDVEPAGFETDRRAFLGRLGEHAAPAGIEGSLEGRAGWTLDPVMALRATARLAPGGRATLAFVTIAAATRGAALEIADRHGSLALLEWCFRDSARAVAAEAQKLEMDTRDIADVQAVSREVMFHHTAGTPLGASPPAQPDLWGLGVSGDVPVMLLRVEDPERSGLLPAAVRAHQWLRLRGLETDLVILNMSVSSYDEPLRRLLGDAMRAFASSVAFGGRGGIHLHAQNRLSPEQGAALDAVAYSLEDRGDGRLWHPADRLPPSVMPRFEPFGVPAIEEEAGLVRPDDLQFDNGFGGFAPGGDAYRIFLEPGAHTPAPWCNVLANDAFGTIVSEAGLGFTWGLNSGEHRITPWSNDPVGDPQGEALYLRDEETAECWSPTPAPAGAGAACLVSHGMGETVWQRRSNGLDQEMRVLVPPGASVKLIHLTLRNTTARPRRLTATYYAEWRIGPLPDAARRHTLCGYHAPARSLIARSGWAPDFRDRIAFLSASRRPHSLTCDRTHFLGRSGTRSRPDALERWDLGGNTTMPSDPCGAYQVHVDLDGGAQDEIVFVLGEAGSIEDVQALARHWSDPAAVTTARTELARIWEKRLGAVRVHTPDPAFDLMVNFWLPYQTYSSRVLARAGFYQAGGAFGYRDQLQDMVALLWSEPERLRDHLLACAAHQFEEGDVLHWWHEPAERGVRTRCSDDMMWLVYATHAYVSATGDSAILDAQIPFLSAPLLKPEEEDRYAAYGPGAETAPLFEHCRRAMERGTTAGAHGLPLMGSGDWNDGMDRVGARGQGESTWLAWFGAVCADGFAALAERRGATELAADWRERAQTLRAAAETNAWDGEWYVRAFDDDGAPWGSASNEECRIDSIAQSWAVFAGSDPARAGQAVANAADRLIDTEHRLVRLLTPPFDRTLRDPGYIRAYPPGVRENGGQYTHASAWLGIALARLGRGDAAYGVFDTINPARHGANEAAASLYRAEPYVIAADVGGSPPQLGQAGWSWYTGAAGWTWRLAVEAILGLTLVDGKLAISPCLPAQWNGFVAEIAGPAGSIRLQAENRDGQGRGLWALTVDGRSQVDKVVTFPADGSVRTVLAQRA